MFLRDIISSETNSGPFIEMQISNHMGSTHQHIFHIEWVAELWHVIFLNSQDEEVKSVREIKNGFWCMWVLRLYVKTSFHHQSWLCIS